MKNQQPIPPKLFLRFFRWFCHPGMLDYIEGDLLEVYERNYKTLGKRKADWRFTCDVLLLFRPGIIRPRKPYESTNTFGMYQSHFKIGWRRLLRNKEYSLINTVGLVLSLTCCILIVALINHHTGFDDFHFKQDRIYRIVTEQHRETISYTNSVPSPLGNVFRENHSYGEEVARMYHEKDVMIVLEKNGEKILFKEPNGFAFAEPSFFDIFNFPLLIGNQKTAITDPNTAIITENIAKKYFGEENPIGQVISYDNKIPFTITGVLKDFPVNTDIKPEIFVSYASFKDFNSWMASENAWGGITGGMYCYTRLREGVAPEEVEKSFTQYVKQYRPNSKNVHHYRLQPLNEVHFDGRYGGVMEKSDLWTLAAIGLFLLITASVNFINLATAQALKRSKEVGVRKVLGSFRSQLFWQFIVETGLITAFSVFFALLAAYLSVPIVNSYYHSQVPQDILLNPILILFSLGLIVLITLLAGIYPAMILTGFKPVLALKGKITQHQLGSFNTRRSLIITQFAISQVLIIGMIVVMHQMRFARQADLGFQKESIVMVDIGSDSLNQQKSLKTEFLRLPGVEMISMCYAAPASTSNWSNSIRFDQDSEEVNFRTNMKLADADYLQTFNLELVAGRNIYPSDTVREVVVNEALLEKLGITAYDEALGKIVYANGGSMAGPIVGVVKNFHDQSFHNEISAALIAPASHMYASYAIKLNGKSALATLKDLEKLWKKQHPDQLFEYSFLDEDISKFYEAEDRMLKGIQVFSFIAIFIGCLGLYGLVSFMVNQKTKEIGIRKVLGGETTQIIWIFGQEFLLLIGTAFLIAAPIGWFLMNNWLQDFSFKIKLEGWIFLITLASSFLIMAVSVGYQVLKAAFINPVVSLKSE